MIRPRYVVLAGLVAAVAVTAFLRMGHPGSPVSSPPPPTVKALQLRHDELAEQIDRNHEPAARGRLAAEQAMVRDELERISDAAPPGVGDHIRRAAEARVSEIAAVRERLAAGETVELPENLTLPSHAPWEPATINPQISNELSPPLENDAK